MWHRRICAVGCGVAWSCADPAARLMLTPSYPLQPAAPSSLLLPPIPAPLPPRISTGSHLVEYSFQPGRQTGLCVRRGCMKIHEANIYTSHRLLPQDVKSRCTMSGAYSTAPLTAFKMSDVIVKIRCHRGSMAPFPQTSRRPSRLRYVQGYGVIHDVTP